MDSPDLISTKDIPPQFLKSAFLAGHVPYKALSSDPRLSYQLYIPSEHINVNPADPEQNLPILPLVVVMHGTRRGSDTFNALVPWSHKHPCAILAPLFPTGLDGPNDIDSYKLLSSKTLRSDLALLSMLDEVSHRWPGISTKRIILVGFSGGGQFAHRFFYLYPERLHAVSVGAPGRVTKLDLGKDWPQGIRNVEEKFNRKVDFEKLRAVKDIQFVIGGDDNVVHGGDEFWKWLEKVKKKNGSNSNKEQLAPMRSGRLQTAKEVLGEWKSFGIEARFDVVPGVAHSAQGVVDAVLNFLEPIVKKMYEDGL
ncbi:poly hydrolase [Mollisia scopiformis]|uniref:Poly hydrolase n=1 Tax=Mollisia scopiformis TaxID=149040 RepID=A0A132B5S8_MOLSC|nr:poly hydrolase [Mollisia scopiformis]KUJ07760.1 poly hydrolase [Mollisia scopiformis]